MNLKDFQQHPNPLAQYYQHFKVGERLLFTGHSHQAWPDCSLQGQIQAWHDAAEFIDAKWARAEEKADLVRQSFAGLLEDSEGDIALGQNTFDLVLRFISALPLTQKPRIVTTDAEFHSLRRLLARLSEEAVELVKIPVQPMHTFIDRLIEGIDDKTAAVFCSKVFYQSGLIVDNLKPVADRCQQLGAEFLVDAYHAINVVPFSVSAEGLENAYIVGGGYKYCQLGEGNCFIRLPKNCQLRPIATGWYGEFATLSQASANTVVYSDGPARFAGATYDPTAHYRAAEVFAFFQQHGLTTSLLREISQHQIRLLLNTFSHFDLDPKSISVDVNIPLQQRGGFITFQSPNASSLQKYLFQNGIHCDNRGDNLRFGPAPYLSDQQIVEAMDGLGDAVLHLG